MTKSAAGGPTQPRKPESLPSYIFPFRQGARGRLSDVTRYQWCSVCEDFVVLREGVCQRCGGRIRWEVKR